MTAGLSWVMVNASWKTGVRMLKVEGGSVKRQEEGRSFILRNVSSLRTLMEEGPTTTMTHFTFLSE